MASDWVKMRVDLYRDPKVTQMADCLLDEKGELAAYVNQNMQSAMTVTRNVTRNAAVGALVAVWGVARHQGQRIGDDLVISAGANMLDDISELPGFAAAMLSAGWVIEVNDTLVFPRFFEVNNVDPADERKAKGRERQQRFRDRRRNVTVTSRNAPRERGRGREERSSPKGSKRSRKKTTKTAAPKTAPKSTQRVSIRSEQIATLADSLFMKIGYSGSDGAILWKIAAAMSAGRLSENDVYTAADNTAKSAKGNSIAYLRRALELRLSERGDDLAKVLATIRVTPTLPKSPPDRSSFGDDLAENMKRKPRKDS